MMKAQDPYILSAMDGKEGQPTVTSTQREGPAAFFFVIFGLIYEALAESSTSSSASGSANTVTIAALEALDSLVRPDYAGKAILDSAVFDEFTTLCYRMAMMESAEVHIPLARVVSSLATTQLGSSGNMYAIPSRSKRMADKIEGEGRWKTKRLSPNGLIVSVFAPISYEEHYRLLGTPKVMHETSSCLLSTHINLNRHPTRDTYTSS